MTTATTPWHGIGTEVGANANLIEDTGLDWTVEQRPLYLGRNVNKWTVDGVGTASVPTENLVESHVANYRSDTDEVLAVVGAGYEVFQNDELAALVEAVEEGGEAEVESALSLRGGRDVFFLMKNSSFELPGQDEVHTYHIFGNNHAGERSIYCLPTSARPWCANILNAIYKGAVGGFKIRHTSSMKARVEDAIEQVKRSKKAAEDFSVACKRLAAKRLSLTEVRDYWDTVYFKQYGPLPEETDDMTQGDRSKITRHEDIKDEWGYALSKEGKRTDDYKNAWTALNAITEWVDHGRTVRGEKGGDQMRIHSNVLGSAAKMKQMALNEALALV